MLIVDQIAVGQIDIPHCLFHLRHIIDINDWAYDGKAIVLDPEIDDSLLWDIVGTGCREFFFLDRLEVEEGYRGHGIGSEALERIKDMAIAYGCPVFLKCGYLNEKEYNDHSDDLVGFLMATKVRFYEANRFLNVNDDARLHRSESVVMSYNWYKWR